MNLLQIKPIKGLKKSFGNLERFLSVSFFLNDIIKPISVHEPVQIKHIVCELIMRMFVLFLL